MEEFETETGHSDPKEDIQIESLDGRERVTDIDQGWAWVALLAGFISMVRTTGVVLGRLGVCKR